MNQKKKTAGRIVLACGICMLASGIICAVTVGTIIVPVLISGSIVVNSVGVSLMQYAQKK